MQRAIGNRQRGIGRDHIDVVGLHRFAIGGVHHRHRSAAADQFGQKAVVQRRQVLDQHEGHAAVGRHFREETLERLQPTGRSTDADDQQWLDRLQRRVCHLLCCAMHRVIADMFCISTPGLLGWHFLRGFSWSIAQYGPVTGCPRREAAVIATGPTPRHCLPMESRHLVVSRFARCIPRDAQTERRHRRWSTTSWRLIALEALPAANACQDRKKNHRCTGSNPCSGGTTSRDGRGEGAPSWSRSHQALLMRHSTRLSALRFPSPASGG